MAKTTKPSRMVRAILEMADDARRAEVMDAATHAKITLRHLGDKAEAVAEPITGDDIRKLREDAHLSQAVFARYLNFTPGYVSQLERGAKRPSGPTLVLFNVIRRKGIEAISVADMTPEAFIDKWRGSTRTETVRRRRNIFSISSRCSASQNPATSIATAPSTPSRNPPPKSAARPASPMSGSGIALPGNTPTATAAIWSKPMRSERYGYAFEKSPLLSRSDMQEIRSIPNFRIGRTAHVIELRDIRSVEGATCCETDLIPSGCCRRRRRKASPPRRRPGSSIAVALRQQYDERRVAHFLNSWCSTCSPKTRAFPTASSPTSSTNRKRRRLRADAARPISRDGEPQRSVRDDGDPLVQWRVVRR